MPEFILFDLKKNTARKYSGDDWFLGVVDTIAAENPGAYPVPANENENRHAYEVFYATPVLEKAVATATKADKDGNVKAEALAAALRENGGAAGRIYLDVPVHG
jgi:hypothetical protein